MVSGLPLLRRLERCLPLTHRAILSSLFAVYAYSLPQPWDRNRGTADERPRTAVSRTGRGSTIGGQPSLRGVG